MKEKKCRLPELLLEKKFQHKKAAPWLSMLYHFGSENREEQMKKTDGGGNVGVDCPTHLICTRIFICHVPWQS